VNLTVGRAHSWEETLGDKPTQKSANKYRRGMGTILYVGRDNEIWTEEAREERQKKQEKTLLRAGVA